MIEKLKLENYQNISCNGNQDLRSFLVDLYHKQNEIIDCLNEKSTSKIELPKKKRGESDNTEDGSWNNGYNTAISDCQKAIEGR